MEVHLTEGTDAGGVQRWAIGEMGFACQRCLSDYPNAWQGKFLHPIEQQSIPWYADC